MTTRRAFSLFCALLLGGAAMGCRYYARPTPEEEPPGCRSHCAHVYEKCVEGGQAELFGLPGVTYDLCRRDQEDCAAHCTSAPP